MPMWTESQFAGHFSPDYNTFINHDWSEMQYGSSEGSFMSPGSAMSPLTMPDGLYYEAPSPMPHSPLPDDSPEMIYGDLTDPSIQEDDLSPGLTYIQPSAFYFDPLLGSDVKPHLMQHDPSRPCSSYSDASMSPQFMRPSSAGTRTPVRILPNPLQVRQMEERKHFQDHERSRRTPRNRKRTNTKSMQMERETNMVAHLKEQNLPWSEIVKKVNARFETNHTASCLQMRLSRYNKRQRDWAGEINSLSSSP
ncbi:hypothetical protein KEM56_007355 [Ascosphaera pollenicola]|nr:hypothetical protein KEM56_007355 [Ascosphaera pollenicola]